MSCHHPYDLTAFLKQELTTPEAEAVRTHLAGCADCRRERVALDRVLGRMRQLPVVTPDAGFVARVLDALPYEVTLPFPVRATAPPTGSLWARLVRGWQERFAGFPMWALSVSAHLVLFAVLTVVFFRMGPQTDLRETARAREVAPREEHQPQRAPRFGGAGSNVNEDHFDPKQVQEPHHGGVLDPLTRVEDPIALLVALRTDGQRRREALTGNGGAEAERAIDLGLVWLTRKQAPDGTWDAAAEGGKAEFTTGLTALTTLAFLANGHTHLAGAHRGTVEAALSWLITNQRYDGLLGPDSGNYMYNHGLATAALLEALMMTGEERLRMPAEAAVLFIIHAQHESGGWGYTRRPRQCDTSVSGWQMLALRLARALGIRGAGVALQKGNEWVKAVTDEQGRVGYQARENFPNGPDSLTAIGLFGRAIGGYRPGHEINTAQATFLANRYRAPAGPATAPGAPETDLYAWHFAALALFQYGGEPWAATSGRLRERVLASQSATGPDAGAWVGPDRWTLHGGRVCTTALGVLTLATPCRYPRLHAE